MSPRREVEKSTSLFLVLGALFVAMPFVGIALTGCSNAKLDTAKETRLFLSGIVAGSPPTSQPVGRPRLVIDRTISMAGFVAPRHMPTSRFNQALTLLHGAMSDADLFSFGLTGVTDSSTLDDLLRREELELGKSFESPEDYSGKFNHDDLLFRLLSEEEEGRREGEESRPLVLVTDGVFSTPQSAGPRRVFDGLNKFLEKEWSVGVLSSTSEFHGIPCGLLHCNSRRERLFYSQAKNMREGKGSFFPLACGPFDRSFHIFVLSPTSDLFEVLQRSLVSSGISKIDAFLLGSTDQKLSAVPRLDNVETYDSETLWPWFMVERSRHAEPFEVPLQLSLHETFPAQDIEWAVKVERRALDGKGWLLAESELAQFAREGFEAPVASAELSPLLSQNECEADLRALTAREEQARDIERDLLIWARRQVRSADCLSDLFCPSLAAVQGRLHPGLQGTPALAALWTLGALDAHHRQRPEELELYRGLAEHHSDAARFGLLEQVLSVNAQGILSPRIPEGTQEDRLEEHHPASFGGKLVVDVSKAAPGTNLYRLRLIPRRPMIRAEILRHSTPDDSSLSRAHKTFRFANLVETLTRAHLSRSEEADRLPVLYLTVYESR